jgi:hypothetical protein
MAAPGAGGWCGRARGGNSASARLN